MKKLVTEDNKTIKEIKDRPIPYWIWWVLTASLGLVLISYSLAGYSFKGYTWFGFGAVTFTALLATVWHHIEIIKRLIWYFF